METAPPPVGRRHALLAVIGEIGTEPERGALRDALERGIRSWNIDSLYCDLNQQLRLFVTRHLAQFSSEVKGQLFGLLTLTSSFGSGKNPKPTTKNKTDYDSISDLLAQDSAEC